VVTMLHIRDIRTHASPPPSPNKLLCISGEAAETQRTSMLFFTNYLAFVDERRIRVKEIRVNDSMRASRNSSRYVMSALGIVTQLYILTLCDNLSEDYIIISYNHPSIHL